MGVSNELLACRIRERLDAMETKFFVRRWPQTDAASEGETAAELIRRDVVAFAERRAMVELVIRPAQKQEHQHSLEMLLEATGIKATRHVWNSAFRWFASARSCTSLSLVSDAAAIYGHSDPGLRAELFTGKERDRYSLEVASMTRIGLSSR